MQSDGATISVRPVTVPFRSWIVHFVSRVPSAQRDGAVAGLQLAVLAQGFDDVIEAVAALGRDRGQSVEQQAVVWSPGGWLRVCARR
jgi:hypothetical protein